MRVHRLLIARPRRDNVWAFVEAMQEQIALQPDDNAHALAGALAAAATLRGTRRGAAVEVAFVVSQVVWTVVTALVPGLLVSKVVGCFLCRKPVKRVYIVRWLLWSFILNPLAPPQCEDAHERPRPVGVIFPDV